MPRPDRAALAGELFRGGASSIAPSGYGAILGLPAGPDRSGHSRCASFERNVAARGCGKPTKQTATPGETGARAAEIETIAFALRVHR
jgi:hypothetical protein